MKHLSLFFLACAMLLHAKAQPNLMFNEQPYGQNVNCVVANGNDVWFGTGYGAMRHNRITGANTAFTLYTNPELKPSGAYHTGVISMTKDSLHRIYASRYNVVMRFNGSTWDSLGSAYGIIMDMTYTDDNCIWIRSMAGGYNVDYYYSRYDIANDTLYQVTNTASSDALFSAALFVNSDGTYWYPTYFYYTDSSITYYKYYNDATSPLDSLTFSMYNTQGSHQRITFLHTLPNGTSVFTTRANNHQINLGLVDTSGSISYYNVPQWTDSTLIRTQFQADALGHDYILFYTDLYSSGIGNFYPDQSQLLKFDGSVVTVYDSTTIGSSNYRFSGMYVDDDNNLWLSRTTVNDRSDQTNAFVKTPSDTWSPLSFNSSNMPGTYFYYGNSRSIGRDKYDNAYIFYDAFNAYSVVDTMGNATVVQFEDKIVDAGYNQYMSVSPGGIMWVSYIQQYKTRTHNVHLLRIDQGVFTHYPSTAMPFDTANTKIASLLATDSFVFVMTSPYSTNTAGVYSLYKFDGVTWTLLPTMNYPNNNFAYAFSGYDQAHDVLWYQLAVINGNYPQLTSVVKYDGSSNTIYSIYSYLLPGLEVPQSFAMDEFGNKWFLKLTGYPVSGGHTLWKWDSNDAITSYDIDASYQFKLSFASYTVGNTTYSFNLNPAALVYDYANHSLYATATHNPTTGTNYIVRFDGSSWHAFDYPLALNTWAMREANGFDKIAYFPYNDKLMMVGKNDVMRYQPTGTITIQPGDVDTFLTNHIHGHVFYDLNADSTYNIGDVEATGIGVHSGAYATLSNENGDYTLLTDSGYQHVTILNPYGTATAPAFHNYDFGDSTGIQVYNHDFAIPVNTNMDLMTDLTHTRFRPGFFSYYNVFYKNKSFDTANAVIRLVYNSSALVYIASSLTPVSINGDTITWNVNNLTFLQSGYISVTLQTPLTAVVGTQLTACAYITPNTTDVFPTDNSSCETLAITSSMDPNEKTVQTVNTNGGASNTDSLTYTIFFQNTGTDTAIFITIRDTLSPNLDLATFHLISSSNPVNLTFLNPRTLEFLFPYIMLPDSSTNEPLSHGFVKYSIKPTTGLATGEVINNRASIYFDFNTPVPTNITTTVINNCPLAAVVDSFTHQLCAGSSVILPSGDTVSMPGDYTTIYSNVFGCDSIILFSHVVLEAVDTTIAVSGSTLSLSSDTGIYQWYDCNSNLPISGATSSIYDAATIGSYSVQVMSQGCTAMSQCVPVMCLPQSVEQTVITCFDDSFLVGNTWYHQSGVYSNTFVGALGCDSEVVTHLTILSPITSDQSFTICTGDSIYIGTQWQVQSGTFVNSYFTVNGCDSTVTTDLTVEAPDTAISVLGNMLTAAAGMASYQWINCLTNQPIPDASSQSFTAIANGTYAAQLTTANGCTAITTCITITGMGIETLLSSGFSLSPNPASDLVVIGHPSGLAGAEVNIVDVLGRTVASYPLNGGKATAVDLIGVAAGTYLVQVVQNGLKLQTLKLVLVN